MNRSAMVALGLTWSQKLLYFGFPILLSALIVLYGPLLTGAVGTVLFVICGALLGLSTWFVSAGWAFQMELTERSLRIRSSRQQLDIPLDKMGALVRNGGFPFPTIWLVLRNAEVGTAIPDKGVDPQAQIMIDMFRKRNPGKRLTTVSIPGGYIRSISEFAKLLKDRIPPLLVDERMIGK